MPELSEKKEEYKPESRQGEIENDEKPITKEKPSKVNTSNLKLKTPIKINDKPGDGGEPGEKEGDAKAEDNVLEHDDKDIDPADFHKYWQQLAEELKDESHSLHVAFTKHEPKIDSENNIEVLIDNSVQESEINQKRTKILGFLKDKLSNRSITLSTKIITNEQAKQKVYFPEEKFELLAKKNPNLVALKDQLNLDFY